MKATKAITARAKGESANRGAVSCIRDGGRELEELRGFGSTSLRSSVARLVRVSPLLLTSVRHILRSVRLDNCESEIIL